MADTTLKQIGSVSLQGSTGGSGKDFFKNISLNYSGSKQAEYATFKRTGATGIKNPTVVGRGSQVLSNIAYMHNAKVGTGFTITNVGKTTSGKNVNIKVTIEEINEGNYFALTESDEGATDLTFTARAYKTVVKHEFIDDSGNPMSLLFGTVISDVDNNQESIFEMIGEGGTYNPPGSGITDKGGNHYTSIAGDLNGLNSAPKGTYIAFGVGTGFKYTHIDTVNATSAFGLDNRPFYTYNLFGADNEIKIATTPPPKVSPPDPPKVEPYKPKPQPVIPPAQCEPLPTTKIPLLMEVHVNHGYQPNKKLIFPTDRAPKGTVAFSTNASLSHFRGLTKLIEVKAPVEDEGCVDCGCVAIGIGLGAGCQLHELNNKRIKWASDTIKCDNPVQAVNNLRRAIYGTWCVNRNIINQLCWIQTQVENLKRGK